MKKIFSKTGRLILFSALLLTLGVCTLSAYYRDSTSVSNHISTGDVRIKIREYQVRDGREVPYKEPKDLVPGDTVSKIPRIFNERAPCWIRAAVILDDSSVTLSGFPGEWKKIGEYYYYTSVLKKSESVDLFSRVSIPHEWGNGHQEQKLSLTVRAEAIQAANFKPDFTAMSPWGNEEIQKCIHETDGKACCQMKNTELSVEFNGQAHRLIAVPLDFFGNFPTAMPGDTLRDSVKISNTTERDAEIFFRTEVKNETPAQERLLKNMKLSIKSGTETLYSGNLRAEQLSSGISLGKYKPDEAGRLRFTVSVPRELDNTYALTDADVIWSFSVTEDDGPGSSLSRTPSGGSAEKDTVPVKTGDATAIKLFCALIVLAVLSVIAVYRRRLRK